jgi:hypothetical protein
VTYFKFVIRKPTPFAMEMQEIPFSGAIAFDQKLIAQVPRSGDLLYSTFFQADLPAINVSSGTACWTRHVGHTMIKSARWLIGGSVIDELVSAFLTIFAELTMDVGQSDNYNTMIGNTTSLTEPSNSIPASSVYVHLPFAFSSHPSFALPLVALQYHTTQIEITLRPLSELIVLGTGAVLASTPVLSSAKLLGLYVFLDVPERNSFAQNPYQCVISTLQTSAYESWTSNTIKSRLAFNHPSKYIVFTIQPSSNVENNRHTDFTNGTVPYLGGHTLLEARLQLNGSDRQMAMGPEYYNNIAPYLHFPRGPSVGIYVMPFSSSCNNPNPSGTLNFSRVDQANLLIRTTIPNGTPVILNIFCVAFNILRIKSGMGGLAFSA